MLDAAPPHSIESEQAFLGAALSDKGTVEWGLMAGLEPTDFYRKDHQNVWAAITSLYDKRSPIDVVTVSEALAADGAVQSPALLVSELVRAGGLVWNAPHYGKIVREKSIRRHLLVAAGKISQLAYSEGEDIESVLDRAENALNQTKERAPQSGHDPDPNDIIARMEGSKARGPVTRWPALNAISSGLTPTHLWVIGGFSSTGKSAVLANLMEDVVRSGGSAMVASTEMSQEQYMLRAMALTSGVPQRVIRDGGMTLEQQVEYQRARTFWTAARIRIFDDLYTVTRIKRAAQKQKEQIGLDVIFVDFIQNLNETGDEVKDARLSAIQLQALAKELNVCIVALSQISNAQAMMQSESGSWTGQYYAFKGSGAIKDAADLAIMLDRDRVNQPDVLWFNVVKNRHDMITRFAGRFDLSTGSITQMTQDEMDAADPNAGRKSARRKKEEE